MDTGDGLKECINPTILERRGEQECVEGCLSSPGQYGMIHRPAVIKFQAQNRNGKFFISTVEGLAAQCVDHECDHLDGILFKSKVDRMLAPDELE
jgi:peptide deformylase